MRLENLSRITWKCYPINPESEDIEISGNIEEYQNECQNECQKEFYSSNEGNIPAIDGDLVDILDELYSIKGLESVCSEQCEDSKMEYLKELSDQYTALLKFRQFYYTEMQDGINIVNNCDDDNDEWEHWIGRIYEWYFGNLEWFFGEVVYFLKHFNVSVKLFKKFVTKMNKLYIYYYKNRWHNYDEKAIELWINFMVLFKDEVFGTTGMMIWLDFLCDLAWFICTDDPYNRIYWRRRGAFIENPNAVIVETTKLVDKTTESMIPEKQRCLLMCCQINPINRELFDIKAKNLLKALKSNNQLKEKYLKGNGCVALMHYHSKKYVAISGDDNAKRQAKLSEIITKLLPSDYNNVPLCDDTRFYYEGKKYIKYATYKAWLNSRVNGKMLDSCVNRMFSCCERKLLTQIGESSNEHFDIYVKKKPCVFCEDALDAVTGKDHSTVHYIKNKKSNMKRRVIKYLKMLGREIAGEGI